MAERNTPKPEKAKHLGQQLLESIDRMRFGTSHFQAVNDYLDLADLQEVREENDRINELEIALLRHQIRQNKSRLRGYSNTYGRIERDFDDLLTVSKLEAQQKFVDPDEQDRYVREVWSVACNGAREIVSTKRDAS